MAKFDFPVGSFGDHITKNSTHLIPDISGGELMGNL
jgi:hypothetical protein